jgi:hypothetical protein
VETVTGLPSSGIEYDVLSVRREMSVARSVPVVLSPVSMIDSVGAGRIGLRVSTPIMERRPSIQSHALSRLRWDQKGTVVGSRCSVLGTIWGGENEVEQRYLDNYWEFLAYQRRPTENSGGEEKGYVLF